MLDRLDETIVALSSASGRSTVGLVRMSGPKAFAILKQVATSPLHDSAPSRIRGEISLEGVRIPTVFHVFRAPRSYTRQDLVEILTIGSPPLLDLLRERLTELGAIPAAPGEFTARAFLNGALDLSQAEGVARLINAQSDTQLRAARRMMAGHWSGRILTLRGQLAELLGLVEAGIDFAEEPIEFISDADLVWRLKELSATLDDVRATGVDPEVFHPLPRILLLGPPNAGKSSLMNRLSGMDRAICSATAGTTRDVLGAPIELPGAEALLLDAAGIDDSPDEIAVQARQFAIATAETADLVCVVLDAHAIQGGGLSGFNSFLELLPPANQPADRRTCATLSPSLIALNKSDLLDELALTKAAQQLFCRFPVPIVPVSARTGAGLGDLRAEMSRALYSRETTVTDESAEFSGRQRARLAAAAGSIERAIELVANSHARQTELLAFELREATEAIADVTGQVTTEDLLGRIFANFCIGK